MQGVNVPSTAFGPNHLAPWARGSKYRIACGASARRAREGPAPASLAGSIPGDGNGAFWDLSDAKAGFDALRRSGGAPTCARPDAEARPRVPNSPCLRLVHSELARRGTGPTSDSLRPQNRQSDRRAMNRPSRSGPNRHIRSSSPPRARSGGQPKGSMVNSLDLRVFRRDAHVSSATFPIRRRVPHGPRSRPGPAPNHSRIDRHPRRNDPISE